MMPAAFSDPLIHPRSRFPRAGTAGLAPGDLTGSDRQLVIAQEKSRDYSSAR